MVDNQRLYGARAVWSAFRSFLLLGEVRNATIGYVGTTSIVTLFLLTLTAVTGQLLAGMLLFGGMLLLGLGIEWRVARPSTAAIFSIIGVASFLGAIYAMYQIAGLLVLTASGRLLLTGTLSLLWIAPLLAARAIFDLLYVQGGQR